MTGLFVTFEGGEGCGKSYQAKTLYRKLEKLAVPALLTHEPGGTPLGEKIARLLKWERNQEISALTETLLFNASRSHLINTIIKPALQDGKIVICDRFTDSTIVYQGHARGLDISTIETINFFASYGIKPDLTILLDVPAETGLDRKSKERSDRFHMENIQFHKRIRDGFLELAEKEKERWLIIDGTQPKNKISGIILDAVIPLVEILNHKYYIRNT